MLAKLNGFYIIHRAGEMAEWSNALVLKTSNGLSRSRVQIPISPPLFRKARYFKNNGLFAFLRINQTTLLPLFT